MKKLPENQKKVAVGINLAPDLLKWIDERTAIERRKSRSNMIECILDRAFTEQLKVDNTQKPIEVKLTDRQKEILRQNP